MLLARLNDGLRATVHSVERLTPTIIEIVIRAPLAAGAFLPGQFYRLQNFEMLSARTPDTTLAMEGLALTGAWTDPNRGLISTIVLEMGGSSDLCALLKPGEPVILMGPTGTPTDTPSGETVLLAGGGLGNAVLFSIGQKLRAEGSKVIYFAGYKRMQDRYKVEQIEAAADTVIWCTDEGAGLPADATAGQELRRQHRRRDAGLCRGRARADRHQAFGLSAHHRDRLGPHDGSGRACPAQCPQALSAAAHHAIGSTTRRCNA